MGLTEGTKPEILKHYCITFHVTSKEFLQCCAFIGLFLFVLFIPLFYKCEKENVPITHSNRGKFADNNSKWFVF